MKKFKKIYIEITNICNLNCSFCSANTRKLAYISVDNFSKIINEVKNYTDYIYLHVKGEPLLHPQLEELLKKAEENNLKVNITTNGTLLKEKAEILRKANNINKINISLHSENNKINYFTEIFETVKNKLSNKTIVYRIWTINNNKLDEKSKNIVEKTKEYYKLSTDIVDKIKKEQNIKIASNIYLDKANKFEWPTMDNETERNGYCYALKTQIAILVDGTVIPCCLDSSGKNSLGNIYKDSFKNIIEGEKFLKLKKSFEDRKPISELCRKCTFKDKFNKN